MIALLIGGLVALTPAGIKTNGGINSVDYAELTPASWASNMQAVWYLEEATTTTRANSGSCGTSCNLTRAGDTTSDGTNYRQGSYSNVFDGTGDDLSCTNANCGTALGIASSGGTGGDITFGCWVRLNALGVNATSGFLSRHASNSGYIAYVLDSGFGLGGSLRCKIDSTEATSSGQLLDTAPKAWVHAVCRFNDSTNTLRPFFNGAADGTATVSSLSAPSQSTVLGNLNSQYLDGWLDECFVHAGALTDKDICRICSCGIDGQQCRYNAVSDSWANKGNNSSLCGSCTLPTSPSGAMGAS